MSATGSFAGARFLPQWGRVTGAFPGAAPVLLRRYARAFERRCAEWLAGVSGQLSLHDNLRTEASVLTEDESEKLARKIAEDLAAHPAAE